LNRPNFILLNVLKINTAATFQRLAFQSKHYELNGVSYLFYDAGFFTRDLILYNYNLRQSIKIIHPKFFVRMHTIFLGH